MKIKILIKAGEGQESFTSVVEVEKSRCVVGRRNSDLVLTDARCSQQHAVIYENDGALRIKDLKSSNGVFVNGKRIFDSRIEVGQTIHIGRTILVVLDFRGSEAAENSITEKGVCVAWPALYTCFPPSFQQNMAGYFAPNGTRK